MTGVPNGSLRFGSTGTNLARFPMAVVVAKFSACGLWMVLPIYLMAPLICLIVVACYSATLLRFGLGIYALGLGLVILGDGARRMFTRLSFVMLLTTVRRAPESMV